MAKPTAKKVTKKASVPSAPAEKKVVLLGTPVKVVASGGPGVTCAGCGSSRKGGMMFRHNDELYCRRTCIPAPAAA